MMMCLKHSRAAKSLLLAGMLVASCVAATETSEAAKETLTRTWIVRTSGAPILTSQLAEWKAVNKGPVGSLEGFYRIDFSQSDLDVETIEALLKNEAGVLWLKQKKLDQKNKSEAIIGTPTEDPEFSNAWHVTNAGQKNGKQGEDLNLLPAWDWGVDGTGRMIAVIDTGVEPAHPDLDENLRQDLALDLVGNRLIDNDTESDSSHGTAVAGIIAAEDNDVGAVGVAYGAHIVPIRYIGVSHSDDDSAEVLTHKLNLVDIYNNSWGPVIGNPDDNNVGMTGHSELGLLAMAQGVRQGRSGLGSIYVFSAGNDNEEGANVNYNSWTNSRYTIAVAALGNGGKQSSYSEVGAPVLVTAPSSGGSLGIFTTDRKGLNGYNETSDYTSEFGGTSASAPMVSGVIALMLQANPMLGWRDVQHILAKTAVQVDSEDEGWKTNGAGLTFNDKYGFGRVDASAAIQTAAIWQNVTREIQTTGSVSRSVLIPNNGTPAESTITLSQNLKIEHVYVTQTMTHSDWGDLRITLISPAGTESVLAEPHEDFIGSYSSWTYSSVQFLDETSQGMWTLRVEDLGTNGTGNLSRWNIRVYGSAIDENSNKAPIAEPDDYLQATYPLAMPVLANDVDPDGDSIQIISLYQPSSGQVTLNENQEIVYTPNEDTFLGVDQLGYTIADQRGGIDSTLVTITDPRPVAVMDQAVQANGTILSIPVLENDFDRNNNPITLVSVDLPTEGSAVVDGEYVQYTPNPDFIGFEDFHYTITDNHDGEKSGKIRVFSSSDPDVALLFDGVNDVVKFDYKDALNITQSISIEAAFYLRSYGEYGKVGYGRILDRDSYSLFVNGTDNSFYPDHCIVFAIETPNGDLVAVTTPEGSIELNRWYQIGIAYDGTDVEIYLDGKPVQVEDAMLNNVPFNGPIVSKIANLTIGEREDDARAFNGIIDWIRIWNKALTTKQLTNYGLFISEDKRDGLAGWFQFNEGVGWQTLESMGNVGTGQVSEALWVPKDPSMLSTAINPPGSN